MWPHNVKHDRKYNANEQLSWPPEYFLQRKAVSNWPSDLDINSTATTAARSTMQSGNTISFDRNAAS